MNKNQGHHSLRTVLIAGAASELLGSHVALTRESSDHLRKVLRLEWNTPLRVVNGRGQVFAARLSNELGDASAFLSELLTEDRQAPELEVVVCLPKAATMEWVVEKATECGATRITPVASSRSVIKPDKKDLQKYVQRWQKISDSALEQSERSFRVSVQEPVLWEKWIAKKFDGVSCAFISETHDESKHEAHLRETWEFLSISSKSALRLVIGPEGGFSFSEREQLKEQAFRELSLGKNILRVETAAVSALTMVELSRALGAAKS